ncbi:MAG: glycosyltransferase family 2 protein, partial [Myxococcales bacterium]|nr:glycosyltransferase family 2 protein [Myxococcales bacterium]
MDVAQRTLTIVLPALDEEEAIGSTIARCLEARAHIVSESPVRGVEIVVVSDGSTDRTEEIARSFEEVSVLAFTRNRGYGAAIKAGFAHGTGDLVGFLDADGTCDPRFFADLCNAIESGADVALGSRMGEGSEMPRVRALGNTVFAWMLGLLSKRVVKDTASGMRVIRREALPALDPLPDGLHFTPAMSARILLEDRLRLAELPMPYAERVGDSKLSVLKDGVRFLHVILQAVMCYRPARPLLLAAAGLGLAAFLLGLGPALLWLREGYVEEWMLYRVLLSSLLFTGVAILACGAAVAERIAALAGRRPVTA